MTNGKTTVEPVIKKIVVSTPNSLSAPSNTLSTKRQGSSVAASQAHAPQLTEYIHVLFYPPARIRRTAIAYMNSRL